VRCLAQGLRRVWDLPAATHSKFVTSLCGLPQLKVELACRCVKFISKCLNSPNYVVRHVVKQGVYFQRLYSPIGRKAHHCVTMVDASLSDIASNTRKLFQAWYAHHDTWLTESLRGKLKLIAELLCIKHHYLKLDLFNADEVSVIIDFLCTT